MKNKHGPCICRVRAGVVLALILSAVDLHGGALATATPPYVMADGGRSADLEQAAQSWRDDPEFNGNWGLSAIGAEYAYAQGHTGLDARIGVIDQPVWGPHPEFAAAVAGEDKLTFVPTAGLRLYDDPYLPFRAGEPFFYDGQMYVDGRGGVATHGTHVAGIAAANRDSEGGAVGFMQGVAYDARLFAADNGDPGPEDGIVRGNDGGPYLAAWQAMIDSGVDVITNSWGIGIVKGVDWNLSSAGRQFLEIRSLFGTPEGGAYDGALLAARSGIVVEFSAGNDSGRHPDAMAGLPTFIPDIENNWIITTSLAPSDEGLTLSYFSSICGYAKYYCIAAPGSEINSSIVSADTTGMQPGDPVTDGVADYTLLSGTSMAGPFVSGSIGVLTQRFPYLANGDVAQILKTTATDLGEPGVDEVYGWGLIDLRKAMNGPGQLMTRMVADLPAGSSDVWSNDIGEAALVQREAEAQAEIAAWTRRKIDMGWENGWESVDATASIDGLYADYRPEVAAARASVRTLLEIRATPPYTGFSEAYLAVENDPVASALIAEFGKETNWLELGPDPAVFDRFIAAHYPDDDALARALAESTFRNQGLEYEAMELYTANLATLTYENGLTKQGAGALWLTGRNTYQGETRVEEGALIMEGSLAGGVAAYGQGVLGGNGRVGGLIVSDGGAVAPGTSIGTLTVDGRDMSGDEAGTVRFETGSSLEVEISADGRSDQLVVARKASLLGGQVDVLAEYGSDPLAPFVAASAGGLSYTFLTAGEGVEGQFEGASSPYAFFSPTLAYGVDHVSLGIERLPFATGGRNDNERQTAAGIDSLGADNALYAQVLAFPAGFASGAFFAAASGALHPTTGGMLLEDGRFLREAAIARLHDAGDAGDTQGPHAWGRIDKAWTQADGDGNAAGYDRNLGGFFVGGDSRIGEQAVLGFLVGYGDSSLTSAGARATADSYRVGVYGGGDRGPLRLRFGAGYARHALKTARTPPAGQASARYHVSDWQVFAEIGRALGHQAVQVEPFVGLAYAHSKSTSFTEEAGGLYRLSGVVEGAAIATGTAGVRVAHALRWGEEGAQFSGTVAWRHAAGDTTPRARLAFDRGDVFVNRGVAMARNALALTAQLRATLSPTATFSLDYAGQLASDLREHALSARLGVDF